MDNIKLETFDCVVIKEESEMLIDSETQWSPTKFEDEENEYYQEFMVECQTVFPMELIKNVSYCEEYSIEFIHESDDDCEDSQYAENEDDDDDDGKANVSDESLYNCYLENYAKSRLEMLEEHDNSDGKGTSYSKVVWKIELKKWLDKMYIKRECPVCNAVLENTSRWRSHIEFKHKEPMEESESNYYFKSGSNGVCKKCNQEYVLKISRYVHSLRHTEGAAKLNTCFCKICNVNSSTCSSIQKHIMEKHPDVVKEFKMGVSSLKCPLCSNTYEKDNHLWYHFLDKHPQEYKAKFRYNCHLCIDQEFSEEELFLQHLNEKHELNSWKVLNYRKPFEDKEYISCIKCNSLFVKNETVKLLKHFLTHENCYDWSCKFCNKKTDFSRSPVTHFCNKMIQYYKKYRKVKIDKVSENPEKPERKIKNLQEFEKYIGHVCPFCDEFFDKMLKWQHHLRSIHEFDTLKGLEMKVIANDSNKLSCVICHTMVANSPQQLHAHRFRHLPYKPYKCLQCSSTLSTLKLSINHVLKRCQDEDKHNIKNNLAKQTDKDIRSKMEIQCSFCDFKKFLDERTALKHYEKEHKNFDEFFFKTSDNSMTCKICHNKYVKCEKKSFEHLHNHCEEKTFKCSLCFRSYPTFKSCIRHLQTLHYVEPINQQSKKRNACETKTSCGIQEQNLVTQFTMKPQLGKPSSKSYTLNEFAEFITYACPECNEGMASQQNWHNHVTTEHNFFDETNLYLKRTDGTLKCPTCNMTLVSSITQQQKHKLTHMPHKSFMCNLCYARFNSLGILYEHFRRLHFEQGSYECPVCLEVLQTSYDRTEHLKKAHPRNEWPGTMCEICYKILSNKRSLNRHMLTHDANRFKYTCNICDAKIIHLKEFKSHMDRHKKRGEIKKKAKFDDDLISEFECESSQLNDGNE